METIADDHGGCGIQGPDLPHIFSNKARFHCVSARYPNRLARSVAWCYNGTMRTQRAIQPQRDHVMSKPPKKPAKPMMPAAAMKKGGKGKKGC